MVLKILLFFPAHFLNDSVSYFIVEWRLFLLPRKIFKRVSIYIYCLEVLAICSNLYSFVN